MRGSLCFFIFSAFLLWGCQSPPSTPLFRISTEATYEWGTPCGYVNAVGDTIVPIGTYELCLTDTLSDFGLVYTQAGSCLAIDPRGQALYEVFWYDNGPDYLADGRFRILKEGKIGYADARGTIVIEPQYSCAFPFENGRAKVAIDCSTASDGEYRSWESDNWIYIDTTGAVIGDF